MRSQIRCGKVRARVVVCSSGIVIVIVAVFSRVACVTRGAPTDVRVTTPAVRERSEQSRVHTQCRRNSGRIGRVSTNAPTHGRCPHFGVFLRHVGHLNNVVYAGKADKRRNCGRWLWLLHDGIIQRHRAYAYTVPVAETTNNQVKQTSTGAHTPQQTGCQQKLGGGRNEYMYVSRCCHPASN